MGDVGGGPERRAQAWLRPVLVFTVCTPPLRRHLPPPRASGASLLIAAELLWTHGPCTPSPSHPLCKAAAQCVHRAVVRTSRRNLNPETPPRTPHRGVQGTDRPEAERAHFPCRFPPWVTRLVRGLSCTSAQSPAGFHVPHARRRGLPQNLLVPGNLVPGTRSCRLAGLSLRFRMRRASCSVCSRICTCISSRYIGTGVPSTAWGLWRTPGCAGAPWPVS